MDGEGSGLLVDRNGESGLSVRFDDRGRVARLLDVLDLVVAVSKVLFSSSLLSAFASDNSDDSRFAEEVSEGKDGVLGVSHELSASGHTRVLGNQAVIFFAILSAKDQGNQLRGVLTTCSPLNERAEAICRSPSSLAMQSASPSYKRVDGHQSRVGFWVGR